MRRVVNGSLIAVCALSLAACGSSKGGTTQDVNGEKPPADAGPETSANQVVQTGTVVDFNNKKKLLAGVTVEAAGQTVTTDANGAYALVVEKGTPYTMKLSMAGYAILLEQETSLEANFDRGATQLIDSETAKLLLATLDGYDPTLGVVSVQLVPTGSCASEGGATLTVSPAGAAKVQYVSGGFPSKTATSVTKGQFPSAVIFNVQPNTSLSVGVTVAGCTETPFPVDNGGVRYTGGITALPGESTSFARVFLQ